jgi:HEAT repeat protein
MSIGPVAVLTWLTACGSFQPQEAGAEELRRLVDRLSSDDAEARAAAADVLKRTGRQALPALEAAAMSSDRETAERARELLRWIRVDVGLPKSVKAFMPGVVDRLSRGDDAVWTATLLEALAMKFGLRKSGEAVQPKDFASLREALGVEKDVALGNPAVAVEDLAGLVDRALRGARSGPEKTVVCMAAARAGDRAPLRELRAHLKDVDGSVRGEAARTLGRLGDREAVPEVLPLLADPDVRVRHGALSALQRLKAVEGAPHLRLVLGDPDLAVRFLALECAVAWKAEALLPELVKHLMDPQTSTYMESPETWRRLGGTDLLPRLRSLRTSGDSAVRQGAERAIKVVQQLEKQP